MSEFNGILESLISDGEAIANEGMSVDTLKSIAKGVAVAAILTGGIVAGIHDHKNKDGLKKHELEAKANAKHEADKKAAYFNSKEYNDDIAYINKKYGLNLTKSEFEKIDKNSFNKKLNQFILQDLKKMAAKFNSNKKLCNDIADKYIKYAYDGDESYKSEVMKEADQIRKGPAHAEYYSDNDFLVCNCDQMVIVYMSDYIQEPFCDALNKKYEREIRIGIMSKFNVSGDGDEGLIGY